MAKNKLRIAVGLTTIILVVEVAGGWIANSLALLSDAGHVLTDLVALALAWFAMAQAERPANARRTFGYHRIGILTALVNAATLLVLVVVIGYEAVSRLQTPEPVTPGPLFLAAAVGIGLNLYIAFGLRGESSHNLNVRAAMLHVVGDVAASVGVIIAAVVILFTGWTWVDPLISLGIALLIARGAWDVLRETVDILMEATPRELDLPRLVDDMRGVTGVQDVHDLHVWSIAGGMPVLSAHVVVNGDPLLSACDTLMANLNHVLAEHYSITHSTLQLEYADCGPGGLYCNITPPVGAHVHEHVD
jgi:cobalt-zinc-cadmium efflux system protein